MKNIRAIKRAVSLANELKLVRISVYEDLHKPLIVDCTIAYDSVGVRVQEKFSLHPNKQIK
jgi:hypothetical protein